MHYYFVDDRWVGNTSDNFDVSLFTRLTLGNVDVEYTFEPLRPRHTAGVVGFI